VHSRAQNTPALQAKGLEKTVDGNR